MTWYPLRHNSLAWVRYLLLFLFVYTATDKILSPGLFANDLLKARYLDIEVLPWLIWLVPFLECLVVLLLFFNRSVRIGLAIGLGLMSVFTWHLLILWRSNPNSPCACGGFIDEIPAPFHLVLNILVMILILSAIVFSESPKKV